MEAGAASDGAGASELGKTAVALAWPGNFAQRYSVLFISQEMPVSQLMPGTCSPWAAWTWAASCAPMPAIRACGMRE